MSHLFLNLDLDSRMQDPELLPQHSYDLGLGLEGGGGVHDGVAGGEVLGAADCPDVEVVDLHYVLQRVERFLDGVDVHRVWRLLHQLPDAVLQDGHSGQHAQYCEDEGEDGVGHGQAGVVVNEARSDHNSDRLDYVSDDVDHSGSHVQIVMRVAVRVTFVRVFVLFVFGLLRILFASLCRVYLSLTYAFIFFKLLPLQQFVLKRIIFYFSCRNGNLTTFINSYVASN